MTLYTPGQEIIVRRTDGEQLSGVIHRIFDEGSFATVHVGAPEPVWVRLCEDYSGVGSTGHRKTCHSDTHCTCLPPRAPKDAGVSILPELVALLAVALVAILGIVGAMSK